MDNAALSEHLGVFMWHGQTVAQHLRERDPDMTQLAIDWIRVDADYTPVEARVRVDGVWLTVSL